VKVEGNMVIGEFNLLPVCGCIIYPNTKLYLECEGKERVKILENAMKKGQQVFLVAQKDSELLNMSDVDEEKIFGVGVLVSVEQILKRGPQLAKILVCGEEVVKLVEIKKNKGSLVASVEAYEDACSPEFDPEEGPDVEESLIRMTKNLFRNYIGFFPKISKTVVQMVNMAKSGDELVNCIAMNMIFELSVKQRLLELTKPIDRLFVLAGVLKKEISIISCQVELDRKLKDSIDKGQRDYYIREQIKVLSSELGNENPLVSEAEEYIKTIKKSVKNAESRDHLIKEAKKLAKMASGSHEIAVSRSYLDLCLELPWNIRTKDRINVGVAAKVLDKNHFGLEKIKEKILEMIAIKSINKGARWQVLCFVGPPGVGKTSIAKAIAEAVGRKYVQISLGGLKDESEIRGHRKTYVGAMPGRIINAIRTAKSKNPLILLDELDKMTADYRSDPTSAFLEVLDYEQNSNFKDNYLEVAFDLSEVLFVTTANYIEDIPSPLLNRLEVVEIGSYTREEKFNILKKHVIPKQLEEYLLTSNRVRFKDAVIYKIIDDYTREAGVRASARLVGSLCRKAIKKMTESNKKSLELTTKNLVEYAGKPKYSHRDILERNEIGTATGLAWTHVGGETMCIEAVSVEGTGKLELTGSLGSVMQESAKAALSYIRKMSDKLQIDKEFYKNSDIHLHVPGGAVPKDGPSAGIAISTAIVSELTRKPIRKDVAITGEITLRGKVLPVGGIKEKVIAAHKVGIKMVVLPKANEADLDEIDKNVRNDMKFVFAKNVDTVWKTALIDY
jgi:ATP-dependent Lon protease